MRWRPRPSMAAHFNPHLPRRRRLCQANHPDRISNFNPHLPRRRRRTLDSYQKADEKFQSTPSSQKATEARSSYRNSVVISIHTFLAEGDFDNFLLSLHQGISIHTFLAEGDVNSGVNTVLEGISIHTFLAEGDPDKCPCKSCRFISIHTFLAEGDKGGLIHDRKDTYFNPHLPRRRRLSSFKFLPLRIYFNPHLPRRRRLY